MRRFMAHLVTEIDFVDGWCRPTKSISGETVQDAAEALSLRTIKGSKVKNVVVEEIKDEL